MGKETSKKEKMILNDKIKCQEGNVLKETISEVKEGVLWMRLKANEVNKFNNNVAEPFINETGNGPQSKYIIDYRFPHCQVSLVPHRRWNSLTHRV